MKARNIIGGILALLLLGGVVGSIGYLSKGFKDFDYKTWFTKDEGTQTTEVTTEDEDNPSEEETGGGSEGGGQTEDTPSEDDPPTPTRQNVKTISFVSDSTSTIALTTENLLPILNSGLETPIFSVVSDTDKVFPNGESGLKFGTGSVWGKIVSNLSDFTFNHIKVTAVAYGDSAKLKVNDIEKTIDKTTLDYEFAFEDSQSDLSIVGTNARFYLSAIEMWTL